MNRTPRQHHGVAVASLHRQAFEPGADGALHKNSGAALQCPVTTARYAMRKKVGCDSVAQTQPRNRDPADRSLLRAVEHDQPFDQRQRERERRRRRRAQRIIVDVVQSLSLLVVEKPARTHGVSTGHPMQSRKQHQDGTHSRAESSSSRTWLTKNSAPWSAPRAPRNPPIPNLIVVALLPLISTS